MAYQELASGGDLLLPDFKLCGQEPDLEGASHQQCIQGTTGGEWSLVLATMARARKHISRAYFGKGEHLVREQVQAGFVYGTCALNVLQQRHEIHKTKQGSGSRCTWASSSSKTA